MSRKNIRNITLPKSKKISDTIFKHEDFIAGIAPNLRGNKTTMYVSSPWKTRNYIYFSTIEKTNMLLRKRLATGENEIYISFDFSTSSNSKHVIDGNTINSIEDMKVLFNQVPLDKVTISLCTNSAMLPLLAFYIVTAEMQGISQEKLSINIVKNTSQGLSIYENDTLLINSIPDILKYTKKNTHKFTSISIPSYYSKERETIPEIAYTLSNGLVHIKTCLEAGLDIDSIAPHLSFSWTIKENHFNEITKMRAARMLWAKIVTQFNPKNSESLTLKIHCQTKNNNTTTENSFNNITRTTIDAMSAVFGGTQSLHTSTFKNSQPYLQQETNITKTVDPWAGSFEIEKQTEEIANKAWNLIKEIEKSNSIPKTIKKRDIAQGSEINTNIIFKELIEKENTRNLLELAIIAAKNNVTITEISNALTIFFNQDKTGLKK